MSARELLEMLGSGAAFGKKPHQPTERRDASKKPLSTINFFAAAAGGAPSSSAGKKRRRASNDGDKEEPSSAGASQALLSKASSKPAARALSKGKAGGSALALFASTPAASASAGKRSSSEGVVEDKVVTGEKKARSVRLEEIACFRRRMGIKARGEEVADPMESFGDMPAAGPGDDARQTRRVILRNVEESAWKEPTPVQMQAVPILVAGRDLLAAAPTGSGKTAAFVMPMILRLGVQRARSEACGVRGLLLAPTRELAAQIHRDVVRLSRGRKLRVCLLTKAGSAKAAAATGMDSKKALSGYDIVVSTPLRLVGLVREAAVSLASVEMVVLDEADKLFDAGAVGGSSDKAFVGQVDEVLAACCNEQVQRALFSATIGQQVSVNSSSVGPTNIGLMFLLMVFFLFSIWQGVTSIQSDLCFPMPTPCVNFKKCMPDERVGMTLLLFVSLGFVSPQVKELAESVLRDPIFLTVGTDNAGAADIDQRLVYVGKEEGKLLAIRQLVQEGLRPPVLVFLQSKDRAKVQMSLLCAAWNGWHLLAQSILLMKSCLRGITVFRRRSVPTFVRVLPAGAVPRASV